MIGGQKEGSYINANVIRKFNDRMYTAEYVDDYDEIPCHGMVSRFRLMITSIR